MDDILLNFSNKYSLSKELKKPALMQKGMLRGTERKFGGVELEVVKTRGWKRMREGEIRTG